MTTTSALLEQSLTEAAKAASATLTIPGMNPTVSLMLIFALFWLGPFAAAASRLAEELSANLRLQFRSGPRLHFVAALAAAMLLTTAVVAYLSAVTAVVANSLAIVYQYAPVLQSWGLSVAAFWRWLLPAMPWLHFIPVSWLSLALALHMVALTMLWLAAHPIRKARAKRLEAILGHLEHNQADQDDEPRSTMRYF
jgi:hypothetical protein